VEKVELDRGAKHLMLNFRFGLTPSAAALCLLFLMPAPLITPAWGIDPADDLTLAGARISDHGRTGKVRFIGTEPGNPAQLKQPPPSGLPVDFGLAFIDMYGASFGINNASEDLLLLKTPLVSMAAPVCVISRYIKGYLYSLAR